ncbi:hypothetical protein CROQUDRAFT_725104 [Cronartium quercuum f. sp. fusiforme G11]|uniref:Uncharacterized protein n=1 Tax=Cronartium quercuum f. sp. fusiforme G11 TaxID=708437 RepID=A0A9P6N9G3_9BASI|nr:hypothetical protein CROQUDRAFT_725104 [Cronartium quercuum f. sp. fusiforme G11]
MIQSFTQMVAVLTTLVQGLEAIAQFDPIGSFLNPFSTALALVLQALQGYFALVNTIFGFEQFVSGCGNLWQQFNQLMAFLVQWGHQQQIWQTNCLQTYGVNLVTFQSAYQVRSISQFSYISTYSSQTVSGSTFIGGNNQFCHGTELGSNGFINQIGRGVGFKKIFSIANVGGLLDGEHGPLGPLSTVGKGVSSVVGNVIKPVKSLLGGLLR